MIKFIPALLLLLTAASIQAEPQLQEAANLRSLYNRPAAQWPAADLSADVALKELAPLPAASLTPAQQQQVALGSRLFNDSLLSRDHSVSCASCHEARFVFSDARKKAIGVEQRVGLRNTPPLFSLQLWQSFFWDGRAATLPEQVLMPISDHAEMDLTLEEALARLNADSSYRQAFTAAFGKDSIDKAQLADALSAFALTLQAPRSRFDDLIEAAYALAASAAQTQETDITAGFSDQELQGLHLFRTKARCLNCHNGPLLSDNRFHVTGFHFFGRQLEDLGRYRFTGQAEDSGKFRTPSLRAVSKTGPWMHNGNMINLRGVMNFYNVGGPQPKKPEQHLQLHLWPQHSPLLKNLQLSRDEIEAVIAFLQVL